MKSLPLLGGILLAQCALAAGAGAPAPLLLWSPQPARQWVEALPLDNGLLGAMVLGGIAAERLPRNEDTVRSRRPHHNNLPTARQVLPEIRRRIFAGDHAGASALAAAIGQDFATLHRTHTAAYRAQFGRDVDFRQRLPAARDRLPPLRIGRHHQLQEWLGDWDDPKDQHRHIFHLYALYPGNEISPRPPQRVSPEAKPMTPTAPREFASDLPTPPGETVAWVSIH